MKFVPLLRLLLIFIIPGAAFSSNGSGWKIAIIDTGIMNDQSSSISRTVEQLCWSESDVRTNYDEFDIASTCKSGFPNDLTSSNAGVVPRVVARSPLDVEAPPNRNTYYFGARHGSTVFDEARYGSGATESRFVVVNNSYYDSSNTVRIGTSLVTCGFHGPNQSVPDDRWPSDDVRCYSPSDAEKQSSVISKIQAAGNVAALNYSAEKSESCSNNSSTFLNLKNANIAVVAAVGNRGSNSTIWYPACNQHVISVGALNSNLSIASSTSLQGTKIDFFAEGIGQGSGSSSPQSSYAAPVIAGAFAVLQSARTEVLTIDEMKFALEITSPSCVSTPFGCRPVITRDSIQDAVECLNYGTCLNQPEPNYPELEYNDGSLYGSVYGENSSDYSFVIDFANFAASSQSRLAGNASASNSTVTIPNERDVVLTFDARTGSGSNSFRVYVNNSLIKTTNIIFSNSSTSQKIMLKRTLFSSGSNTIRIEPRYSSTPWGISNIRAAFTPVIELVKNQLDSSIYGSEEDPERPTGLRASFELDNVYNDVIFALIGWDINEADEIAVFINSKHYGYLSTSISSQNNQGDIFTFDKADLVTGTNVIELVQKEVLSVTRQRWGVTNLVVSAKYQISPSLVLGVTDTVKYGWNYGTDHNLFELNAKFTPVDGHDHVLSWKVFDNERSGDIAVYLNNSLVKNVRTTPLSSTRTERITVAWRWFQPGVNTLTFKVKVNSYDDTWGITNLLVDSAPIVNLDDETNIGVDYGYYPLVLNTPSGWSRGWTSTQDYQTRLHATFTNATQSNKAIRITGWDVGSTTELAVYLNGTFLQYLNSGGSSTYSEPNRVRLPRDLLVLGTNTISIWAEDNFSGFQVEKWGVKFDGIRPDVNMAPIIYLLLEED